ncbi:hypothetical protein FBZ94_11013 [Bradyrhizobium sacchari]|uniref:Uncharacterized protein n=1 Tax=Bradyrhizobium sacchari TaxID=1399419 RepID=A0A560JEM4_9BRAD|nr:hypothetical protein FBZ94_11013 [Bradyrhizobium sacchari]TWB69417.1 hypothetical protein FBZ95_10913 [Bradyrhizobium sacchari]
MTATELGRMSAESALWLTGIDFAERDFGNMLTFRKLVEDVEL